MGKGRPGGEIGPNDSSLDVRRRSAEVLYDLRDLSHWISWSDGGDFEPWSRNWKIYLDLP